MMKQRILQTIVALVAIAGGATAQTLSVASVEATAEEQAELVVSASDMTGVTALQFNLALPQGITLNESAITKGEAASGHTLSVQKMDNGDRLVVLYHTDLGQVGNGTLLRLPITMGQEIGSFSGSLYTVRTANTEAESHECSTVNFSIKKCATPAVSLAGGKLSFSCKTDGVAYHYSIAHADVKEGTATGSIDLTNTYIISVYATKDGYENSETVRTEIKVDSGGSNDINGDGVVNIVDVTTLIDIILNAK